MCRPPPPLALLRLDWGSISFRLKAGRISSFCWLRSPVNGGGNGIKENELHQKQNPADGGGPDSGGGGLKGEPKCCCIVSNSGLLCFLLTAGLERLEKQQSLCWISD